MRCRDCKACRLDRGDSLPDVLVPYARDQKILPDREPDVAVTAIASDFCEPPHLLRSHLSKRQRDADPVQPRLFLLVHADMSHAIESRTWRERFRRYARQGAAEFLLDQNDELLHSYAVYDVFQPCLKPVGSVAEVDKYSHNGVGDLSRLGRADDDAGLFGEIPVAGDASDPQPEPDARLHAVSVSDLDRGEGNVIGVLEHGDLACAIEGNIEFARQSRERAVVENVVMPCAGIFAGVEQFLRIYPGGRCSRDIANVVGARPTCAKSDILNAFNQGDSVLRRYFANLQVGAGRDM